MRINCRWRTSFITLWKMLLAPSRLMNPNWQGLRHGGSPNSPVKQVFHSHTYGNGRVLCWSGGASLRASVVSITNSSLSSLRCLNTEGWHRKVALFTHSFRLQAEGATFLSCGLLGLWIAWTSLGFPAVLWSGICGNQERGHDFLFFLSCLVNWECLEVWGIT